MYITNINVDKFEFQTSSELLFRNYNISLDTHLSALIFYLIR